MSPNVKFVVGVIGTQNTGKSTFIQDLIHITNMSGIGFQTVGCDYRKKVEEAGLQINRNGNLQSQKIICDTLIEQLNIISRISKGYYITDRSPIDAYAYTMYLYRHNPELNITEDDLNEMLVKVRESVKSYDKLVYIDLDKCDNVVVVDDKFRDTNMDYRREIDSIFKETLEKLNDVLSDKVIDDICGDRETRVNQFLDILDGRKVK